MPKYWAIHLVFINTTLKAQPPLKILTEKDILVGAQRFDEYLPKLTKKRVAIVTNASGVIGKTSLVDTLIKLKVNVKKIFGPEHGFRGIADAGEKVSSNIDKKTGLPVVSLYGAHKKPTKEDLQNIDFVIYDIQDVGVRFYTFISTLSYVMEACAEQNKELIVLDRPNPNGFYVDGPVMTDKYKSFLGLHNIPLVYGMTTGEYALMVNGEGWLSKKTKCKLTVIPVKGYNHKCTYVLPVKPSPNLPNLNAVLLYPSLGLFEGTVMSLGRGTEMPFEVIGHPDFSNKEFSFIPKSNTISKEPKYKDKVCYGFNLKRTSIVVSAEKKINLKWLIDTYNDLKLNDFFDKNFNYHSGNETLQQQIKEGKTEDQIRDSWQEEINSFKLIRKNYLLYTDFE